MLISLKEIQKLTNYSGSAEELGAKLTMLGLELDGIIHPYENIKDIVIGKVLTREKHPEADKLSVCTVDVGKGEILNIVCGAPNVQAGITVPVAKIGTTMPDGLQIKKAKLRGVESCGMICSERELKFSEEHNGIMVLDNNLVVGQKLTEALDLHTEVLEFGITPNRADCLSFIGITREVALAFDLPSPKTPDFSEIIKSNEQKIKINIIAKDACKMYSGIVIENVEVKESPAWLKYFLHAHNLRSISNIVDITNYILMTYGQPLHAFDLDLLEGNEINVRLAKDNEEFVTLDSQNRKLCANDMLICDKNKPVALGGVMGGLNTEINKNTKRVFIECAVFAADYVRKTSRRLGLVSDSSYRYERGIDEIQAHHILPITAKLILDLAGGQITSGICKTEAKKWISPIINFRLNRAQDLLGIKLDSQNSLNVLNKLGCKVTLKDAWQIEAPSYRQDLQLEVDIIEELGRVYGMDKIPATLPIVQPQLERVHTEDTEFEFLTKIKYWGCGLGLNEVVNYSFVGHADLDRLNQDSQLRVEIVNPLSEEQKVMRTILAPGLFKNLRQNSNQNSLRIFEVAKNFHSDSNSETGVLEQNALGILVYNQKNTQLYPKSNEQSFADYSDIKGIIEHLIKHLRLDTKKLVYTLDISSKFAKFLTPAVKVAYDNKDLAYIGQLKTEIADFYNAKKAVFYAELDLEILRNLAKDAKIKFTPLAIYPSIKRDITVVTENTLHIKTILDAIYAHKVSNFESAELIDIYEPNGKSVKNLTFRISFRNNERTLQDADADKGREKIVANLVEKLGVTI